MELSRRGFLSKTLGLSTGLFASAKVLGEVCQITPAQTKGPFYPLSKITDNTINDLSFIQGHNKSARGLVVYITGVIQDERCQPVEGALVEIWQAADSGRYNHPSDESGLELDLDFQCWGEYLTEANGRYAFKTILPGSYPADVGWFRPPHIHFRVTKRGFQEMITQSYFAHTSFTGDLAKKLEELNRKDLILQSLSNPKSVIVEFDAVGKETEVGSLLAYEESNGQEKLVKVGTLKAQEGEKVGNFAVTLRKLT